MNKLNVIEPSSYSAHKLWFPTPNREIRLTITITSELWFFWKWIVMDAIKFE